MSSHIQKSCVGLEATLSDSKKKYGDKVNTLLSAWEHVANFIPAATPEVTQSLIEWVYIHTLKLVLRGEWPTLSPATKTHLSVTLQRCASHLVHHQAAPRCTALIALVHDPWSIPALDSILNGQPDSEHEEEFCCSEKGELLTMRLKILCEDRCEDIAIKLAAACVRSLRRSDRLRSLSEPQHVQFMLDVYIVLLYKWKRMQDILAQLKLMDLNDALEVVQRLSGEKPTKYGTARVWRNSIKAAELVAQYLVTAGMVRPVGETGASVLEQILNSWAMLHAKLKDIATTLPGMIRKLIEPAESAHHIYIFCAVLLKHFGESVKPLVIELYIRALTTDMNELENQKAKNDKEKVRETAERLSTEFLRLADVVDANVGIARECVLTAFSLHPTRACYNRIIEMAVACGKTKQQDTVGVQTTGKENVESRVVQQSEQSVSCTEKVDETSSKNVPKHGSPQPTLQSLTPSMSQSVRGVEMQSTVPKIFDRSDQLLKNILSSPLKGDAVASEKCNLHPKREPGSEGPLGELCFNCGQFTGTEIKKEPETSVTIDRSLDALILINGDAVTGSANYDEKCVPNQVLDAEKLGLTPQLCDDLAVVLSSPRYHMLSWVLDWKELHMLCEKYLENPEEMGSKEKELKYLNIDYSQFKDWPSEDENEKDVFFGIEKGYEQWVDMPSDSSEQFGSFQPAGGYKRSTTRRSLDDSTDSDSGSVMRVRRTGRQRKVHRLESSESDYESAERKTKQHFRNSTSSVSDTDTNTQDSQTDSLGSDGCRLENKNNKNTTKEIAKKRGKSKLTVDTVSHFHMLVNENIRHPAEDVSGSDVSSNDIITLFSADMDENKRETIKGSSYTSAAPLIITEKRSSDPAVLKSLRMFRPQNAKKPVRMAQLLQKNLLNKSKESINPTNNNTSNVTKFAPMLSTLNLNPKIVLTRADEVDRKLLQKKPQLSAGDLSSELINITKTMPFSPNKNAIGTFHKRKGEPNDKGRGTGRAPRSRKNVKTNLSKKYDILAKAVRDSDILAKNVPGLNTLDMMVPPRVQSTVNVVQLSRNIPQSPNSGSVNSGNTPPRNRTSSMAGSIQLPGTPSSGGHDSGVGMSPAGQTPPPRSSALHDVGEEANQPPDTSPTSSTNAEPDSPRATNQRNSRNESPTKSPSPSSATLSTTLPISSEQMHVVRTPDGNYQLTPISQSVVGGNQRSVLTLQSLEESGGGSSVVGFSRQIQRDTSTTGTNRNAYDRLTPVKVSQQSAQNTGLPKFQQAFGKTIYTLATETTTTTVATTSTTDTITQQQQPATIQKTTNLSKAVQTSVPSSQTNATINVASLTNIPNRQLSTGRQILSIVQSSSSNAGGVNSQNAGQTLTQLVQSASPGGVIYTHKIPVTISTTNPSQLNIIPAISHTNSIQGGRTSLVKVNIINPGGSSLRQQQNIAAIQTVLSATRLQQQQQQQQQQQSVQPQPPAQSQPPQQSTVRSETLINSPIEVPTQVSSTTLEQLREFESVLEQVKERSTIQPQLQSTTPSSATTTVQTQTTSQQSQAVVKQHQQQTSVSALAQQLLIPTQSPTSNEFASNGGTVTFQQQDVFSQKNSLTYVNQSGTPQKVSNTTPLVVVTSYCQPAASPALSVTSQSSSSPCVTPAPASVPSAGKTPPTPSPKSGKKSLPKTVKTTSATTTAAKASPIPKPQQKPQEDEQTAQRIYTILAEYAEQLRNSPDLNNKPAPRRRSNPPTNPSQSSKRKKSSSSKSKPAGGPQASEMSPSNEDLGRTMGSEDSSSGVAHVQDSPAGFSAQDEATVTSNVAETSTETRSLTNDSNDGVEVNLKRRNLIFTEPGSGQTRAVIVQEAVQSASVSVSEALGKMGGAAVFVPGANYIHLPMNIQVKGGSQQFTIVSSHSKLLTAVPTVRTSGNTGVSNALVLQSILNSAGKIITQSPQVKQMKVPTLQTLGTNQSLNATTNVQNASVVMPQSTSTSTQFTSDSNTEKNSNSSDNVVVKTEPLATAIKSELSTNTILVNKSSAIGIIQRNINEIAENQQICGVITSNPNLTLQGTRFLNSTIAKLSTPACIKTENVVCLAPTATAVSQCTEKKIKQEHQGTQAENPLGLSGQTIALAFAAQTDMSVVNNSQSQPQLKETKEASTEITSGDKVISPKTVKRKIDDVIGVTDNITRTTLITTNSVVSPSIVTSLQSNTKIESVPVLSVATKQPSIESTAQFLVSGGPSGSDSQSSPLRQPTEVLDSPCKVGNGLLCGNARLQEAWEPERKSSPDTPWRYVPTSSTNQLAIEPLKVYSRDNENSEVHSVLQIINKGQPIEMSSGQVYQTNTKKYFMNHTLEPFQQYPNKTTIPKSQSNPRLDRELLQQRMERKAAAMERELRLQKSLSEECEDLGVDEPSTSDLFPEADLLFDTNHSPSFDHLSQDASCSQPLGMKLYNAPYFRPLDSSSGSRDTSPVAEFKINERRKNPSQRTRTLKDTVKRAKREKSDDMQIDNPAKHIRLSLDNLSQDEASNSNSDVSRLSSEQLPMIDNESSKDTQTKMTSRNGSKEGSPSSISSEPSNMKLDMDMDSESLPPVSNANNVSAASSGDESMTMMGSNTADVTIPSPLSPIAGPLLSTHKYTYTNKKRATSKVMRPSEYLSWESPMSERTRSSSDDEDSSISESMSSQTEDNTMTNGLDDSMSGGNMKNAVGDRCTYVKKKDKLQVSARVVLNRTDSKSILTKRMKSDSLTESGVVSSDKTSEPSDDESCHTTLIEPDCRARRSSLRGHVKKGCACCNGSPERPKKKAVKMDHKLKKKLASKQLVKKR